jgi:hypothetical protein
MENTDGHRAGTLKESTDLSDINSPGTLSPALPLHYLDGAQDLHNDMQRVRG